MVAWKDEIYERDGWKCQRCGTTVNLTLHHIIPKSKYPEHKRDKWNLVALCSRCHDHYHNTFCKDKISQCNPYTFITWMGAEWLESNGLAIFDKGVGKDGQATEEE